MTAGQPGWFEDPQDPTVMRFHDGVGWTGRTTPRGQQTGPYSPGLHQGGGSAYAGGLPPPGAVPAGWYPDPHVPGGQRYLDGRDGRDLPLPVPGAVVPGALRASSAPQASSREGLSRLLFTMDGRIGRQTWWLFMIAYTFALLIPFALAAAVAIQLVGLVYLFVAVLFYPWLCVSTKRWHDHDKSAWWVLIGMIPVVGSLWVFIECGCLAGTPGPNRFGPPITTR